MHLYEDPPFIVVSHSLVMAANIWGIRTAVPPTWIAIAILPWSSASPIVDGRAADWLGAAQLCGTPHALQSPPGRPALDVAGWSKRAQQKYLIDDNIRRASNRQQEENKKKNNTAALNFLEESEARGHVKGTTPDNDTRRGTRWRLCHGRDGRCRYRRESRAPNPGRSPLHN